MEIVRLNLLSKNNKKNGIYLYQPIVKMNDGKYYWCNSIKSNIVLKVKDIKLSELFLHREIPVQFYKANGI